MLIKFIVSTLRRDCVRAAVNCVEFMIVVDDDIVRASIDVNNSVN